MAILNLNRRIKNLARGGRSYRGLRRQIFRAFADHPGEDFEKLTAYLAKSFYSIVSDASHYGSKLEPLNALPLTEWDWEALAYLSQSNSIKLESNYFRLAADFVIANKEAVKRLSSVEREISKNVLDIEPEIIASAYNQSMMEDRQSLFMFKLYSALHADSRRAIADHFASQSHSEWVKTRLLYPLIFYYINMPSKEVFEQVLGQIFPTRTQKKVERDVVKLILNDNFDINVTFAFKCYVALLCHPFDALELIASHFEYLISRRKKISKSEVLIVEELIAATGSDRLVNVLSFYNSVRRSFKPNPTDLPICSRLGLSETAKRFFEEYVRSPQNRETAPANLGGLFGQLAQLRYADYPEEEAFRDCVQISRRYGFCEAGRFISVLLTSLYMVERKPVDEEVFHLVQHLRYFGAISPYTLCSPRGAHALDTGLFGKPTLDSSVSRLVNDKHYFGRWWIKALHWRLHSLERSMKIAEWLKEIRKSVKLSGNSRFLSGIDWAWIDEVIKAVRIRPFQGKPDGIYLLVLRQMEQRQRDPNSLKVALTPFVRSNEGVAGLVNWLMSQYQSNATAFVRFFLTPTMILRMKLEASYTAALSRRIDALEDCAAEYGFSQEVMTADQYAYELRSLATALTFMSVGAAQFELPWSVFSSDAANNAEDAYKAFDAFNQTYNELPLLSTAHISSSHVFGNKELKAYELPNQSWPLVITICSIIDTFLTHPSYGIESILAIRIRHDNLRREFAIALANAKKTKLPNANILQHQATVIFASLESSIYSALQAWIDKYMHTKKSDGDGIFDFLPSQPEMQELVAGLPGAPSLSSIVDHVAKWIAERLQTNLETAREKMRVDLRDSMQVAVSKASASLILDSNSTSLVNSAASLIETSVQQKLLELCAWFEMPATRRVVGLTYGEMKLAVEGRFHDETVSGQLLMSLYAPEWVNVIISPDDLRLMFDLWSELTLNAVKYGKHPIRMRISSFSYANVRGLRFSSLCRRDGKSTTTIQGLPNLLHEPMLKAGKSGLKIAAALSATMARHEVELRVSRGRSGFHVFVPLMIK